MAGFYSAVDKRPRISNFILAGSVLNINFHWGELLYGGKLERVVNDCGISDWVLVLNQITVLFTGMAGRIGFSGMTSRRFLNRWFKGGHSHYFEKEGVPNDDFMKTYWLPLLDSESVPESVDQRPIPTWLGGIGLFLLANATPLKLFLYALVVWLPTTWVFSLYESEKAQRIRANEQTLEAVHQRDNALRLIEWVVRESAYFDYNQLSPMEDSIRIVGGITDRLNDIGFSGVMKVSAHLGRFCLDRYDPSRLAPPQASIEECQFGMTREYALALGDRMASIIAETVLDSGFGRVIKTIPYGIDRPRFPYPETGSAGEWNRIARLNNRVEIFLNEEPEP